jgi:hypothetical protein
VQDSLEAIFCTDSFREEKKYCCWNEDLIINLRIS